VKSKAAVLFESPGRWEVCDIEVDDPREQEVLVRVVASGVCRTDVHYMNGRAGALPMCGGHEGAGIVEAIGPGVTRVRPGDHVVMSFIPSCGHCVYCASGHQNLCNVGAVIGSGRQFDGTCRMHHAGRDVAQFMMISTFSAWSTVNERSLLKVPDDLPLESLCLLSCGVGTGFGSATNAADVQPGDVVIVMGIGGVGINAVQGASLAGASSVIAVDPVLFKREVAAKLGATSSFPDMAQAAECARELTNGQGADSAIVTTGVVTGDQVAEAFDAIGKGGTVVVTGLADPAHAVGVPLNLMLLVGYQKRIQGCLFGMGNPAVEVPREIALYRAGRLKLDELVTARYRLDEINTAVDDLLAGRNIRGVVVHEH
jgi:S-(hydroxymethyl)glutathione dehydrogenase/alcohol dehydrogenase